MPDNTLTTPISITAAQPTAQTKTRTIVLLAVGLVLFAVGVMAGLLMGRLLTPAATATDSSTTSSNTSINASDSPTTTSTASPTTSATSTPTTKTTSSPIPIDDPLVCGSNALGVFLEIEPASGWLCALNAPDQEARLRVYKQDNSVDFSINPAGTDPYCITGQDGCAVEAFYRSSNVNANLYKQNGVEVAIDGNVKLKNGSLLAIVFEKTGAQWKATTADKAAIKVMLQSITLAK